MRRLTLAGLALLTLMIPLTAALAQGAPPTDWRIAEVEPDHALAYAPSTVRKTGSMATYVSLWRWRDPLSPSAAANSILARHGDLRVVELNCATGQFRHSSIRYFGADLKMMTARTGLDGWAPGDRASPLFAAICGGKPLPGEPVVTRPVEAQLAVMGERMAAATRALPAVVFTPVQRAAILCSERITVMQDAIASIYDDATGDRKAAMVADFDALGRISKAFDDKHPTYPATPEGRARLEAQRQLIAGDAVAKSAYARYDQGDRAPLLALMRRCEVMSGIKALRPDFGQW